MTRPNCSRTSAYPTATSRHARTPPAASAAASVRATRVATATPPAMTPTGAPVIATATEGRVGSSDGQGATLTAERS